MLVFLLCFTVQVGQLFQYALHSASSDVQRAQKSISRHPHVSI